MWGTLKVTPIVSNLSYTAPSCPHAGLPVEVSRSTPAALSVEEAILQYMPIREAAHMVNVEAGMRCLEGVLDNGSTAEVMLFPSRCPCLLLVQDCAMHNVQCL